jgi:broad specificity phosphatase PhoE
MTTAFASNRLPLPRADPALTIELVAHLDAGDRRLWPGDQDARPLSELGRRQAARLAEALAAVPLDALYSSPALRCRQTLEPLAERFGLPIAVVPDLRETDGWLPPPGWTRFQRAGECLDPHGGAYAAGRAWSALRQIRAASPGGRVAVCTHGDMVPALIAFLIGAEGLSPVPDLVRRGGWYTIRLAGDEVGVQHHDAPSDFPRASGLLWDRIGALSGQTLTSVTGRTFVVQWVGRGGNGGLTVVPDRSGVPRQISRRQFDDAERLGLVRCDVTAGHLREAGISGHNDSYVVAILRAIA